ncbi:hypothetical protein E2320_013297 [Naja naja]|nr:hypothetical protein E2320_013297 [Naja naja]
MSNLVGEPRAWPFWRCMVLDLGERVSQSLGYSHPPHPQNQQSHRNNEGIKSPCKEHPCVDNYTGARCEAILLPSIKSHPRGELFVAVLASVVVLSVLESVSAFRDTLNEERDLQDQISMQKYAQLMFLLFPDSGGQRYVKMLRETLESTPSLVIKIDKMLSKYFRTLVDSIEKLLDPFHPFLLKVKSALRFSILQRIFHARSKLW